VSLFPARLEPVFVPRIWGARSLDLLFPEKTELAEPIGEVWMTGKACRFAPDSFGAFAGKTLGEVWPSLPPEWTGVGGQGKAFPLLVKFLFPREKLSIQVHPNDDYARRHEADAGGMGKTEMWYAIAANPGAGVLVNLKAGVTPSSFRRALADGTAESSLEFVPVSAGDAVFVPAGTVHTIGPGLVLCEIQQDSDITYRVFDYDRRDPQGELRPLHLEKALAVMNFGEQGGGKIEPVEISRGALTETFYMVCRHFAIEKWDFSELIAAATSSEHFDLLIILEGKGAIQCTDQSLPYDVAQVWIVPAAMGAYQIAPQSRTALLHAHVPPNLADVAQRLAAQNVPESAWSRVIYP
jgi:mannose-6-phosphate isomerase